MIFLARLKIPKDTRKVNPKNLNSDNIFYSLLSFEFNDAVHKELTAFQLFIFYLLQFM